MTEKALMPTKLTVTLFGEASNNAVILIPGRRFPAVAVQHDTLCGMMAQVQRCIALLETSGQQEALDEFEFLNTASAELDATICIEAPLLAYRENRA